MLVVWCRREVYRSYQVGLPSLYPCSMRFLQSLDLGRLAMNRHIWKYPVSRGRKTLIMPEGAEVLCVQTQFGVPQMWTIVDPEAPQEYRTFHAFSTGDSVGTISIVDYIGTYQEHEGNLIFHLFEVKE